MGMTRRRTEGGGLFALARLWRDESATTSLEYALMLALVGLSAVAGYRSIGDTVAHGVSSGNDGIESVRGAGAGYEGGSIGHSGSTVGAGSPGGGAPACPATGAASPGSG